MKMWSIGCDMQRRSFLFLVVILIALISISTVYAQEEPQSPKGTILLTIFLRHDQTKTLDEIQSQLKKNGFYKRFPLDGTEIVSWYVMMGIGQVVTLRLPAEKLREVNLAIEHGAWGAFRTEFYPTYDYRSVWEVEKKKAQ